MKTLDGPRALALVTMAFLASGGCDSTFEPIADNDRHFSVFGYLDASADTQWVRVMPVRPAILRSSDDFDATVTLERVGGANTVVLRDSLFRFEAQDVGAGAAVYVKNFWTTERIEPGATYRFTATRPDGSSSSGMVPIPDRIPEIVVGIRDQSPTLGFVRFEGVEHLAMVQVLHRFSGNCTSVVEAPYHAVFQPLSPGDSGDIREVGISTALGPATFPCPIEGRDILIVASGSPWPFGLQFASGALAISEIPSNIANAVGFLGGVLRQSVPWETCALTPPASATRYCELTYSASSVQLRGTVSDATCGGPLSGAWVELTEIAPSTPGPRRVRRVQSNADGSYSIGALEGGMDYGVQVSHPDLWPPDDPFAFTPIYLDHVDTLAFLTGEETTVDIGLRRQVVC